MKIGLKDFQTYTVGRTLTELRLAATEIKAAEKTEAVVLSAPTGSGKTIMATQVIERLLEGDASHEPQPDAVFLWLTDLPELNEQTRRKMLATSTVLGPAQLVTIESTFDEETFRGGRVYFLNTQKLGRDKNLTEGGDLRTFTIWQTITNTIKLDSSKFYLIIDEAHRGMTRSRRDDTQALTIVQKFIKGSAGEIRPVPMVLGISATPDRFRRVLEGTDRVVRSVDVDPADVRASGLIKDYVRFRTPREEVPSDITLLRGAVERVKFYETTWEDYCKGEGIPLVSPLLIVQVEDGDERHITKTKLDEVLAAIEDVVGTLPDEAFANSFQEGTSITIGSRAIRYIAPSDINDDSRVQVVFFKRSLSTGWDCPRAEVMMSFRRGVDATLIAQLVGRMVRSPMARRVEKNEALNSVTLLLPHYNAEELEKVVARLKAADPDSVPPTEFTDDNEVEDLRRASGMEACFEITKQIPTYVMPSRVHLSETGRLMKTARLLVNDTIHPSALDDARTLIFSLLDSEYDAAKDTDAFKESCRKFAEVEIEERTLPAGADLQDIPDVYWVASSTENVDDRFREVGRRIGEGLHTGYWRHLADLTGDARGSKVAAMAVLSLDGVMRKLEDAAKKQSDDWYRSFQLKIRALSESRRQAYDEILGATKDPVNKLLDLPEAIEVVRKSDARPWAKHIYVNARQEFETSLNGWETQVMQNELGRLDVVGWYRNLPRKPYALCIPYEDGEGEKAGLYPDFIVFRQSVHGVVVDIVDPHLERLSDAYLKAKGLALYLERHPSAFGRAIIARVENGNIQRLDLADERVRSQVRAVTSNAHLVTLYDTLST